MKKIFLIIGVLFLITAAIVVLEVSKPARVAREDVLELNVPSDSERVQEKNSQHEKAKEILNPSGFINTSEFKLADLVGKKVILIDFWTYSCINCQRTLPYINSWYDKYRESGLEIVGVHAPEFAFEKKPENVQDAVERFGIKFPVVLDNDFATWQSYNNHHWPHKYLIDIDGFIVYDHIGEGKYEETEKEIQKALEERKQVLGEEMEISHDFVAVEAEKPSFKQSPEIYFGSRRNKNLGNVKAGRSGQQELSLPEKIVPNKVYLEGKWNFTGEYAENISETAKIVMHYQGKNIFMVASAENEVEIEVLLDGKSPGEFSGANIENGKGIVKDERLYKLIEGEKSEEQTIEILINNPGLKMYTFTFG